MTHTGCLIIALLVAPTVVRAQTMLSLDSAKVGNAAQSFLERPYTVMDHAIDALRDAVNSEAERVSSTRHYSNDLVELKYGIFATSGAYRSAKSRSVNVWIDFDIDHIIGEPATVCTSNLQVLANEIFGSGKDIEGMSMREKKMLSRFGSAVASDTSGAFSAAKTLLLRTTFLLRLSGTGVHSRVSCWQDVATGVVHAGNLPDER